MRMLWRSGGSVTGITPLALPQRVTLACILAKATAVSPILARAAQPIIDSAPGAGTDSSPDELARLDAG